MLNILKNFNKKMIFPGIFFNDCVVKIFVLFDLNKKS